MTVPAMEAAQITPGAIKRTLAPKDTLRHSLIQLVELEHINSTGFAKPLVEGSVISVKLTDESGPFGITALIEEAADVDQKVHAARVYIVSQGQVKQANERFNRSTSSL